MADLIQPSQLEELVRPKTGRLTPLGIIAACGVGASAFASLQLLAHGVNPFVAIWTLAFPLLLIGCIGFPVLVYRADMRGD